MRLSKRAGQYECAHESGTEKESLQPTQYDLREFTELKLAEKTTQGIQFES